MASSSSITTLAPHQTLDRNCGLMVAHHTVAEAFPSGAIICDLKTCENCGRPFTRKVASGIRFCGRCIARRLVPPDRDERESYRNQLPNENIAHLSYHLIKYDDTLLGVLPLGRPVARRVNRKPPPSRSVNSLGDWVNRLIDALACGPLTSRQIAAIYGGSVIHPSEAVSAARNRGVRLTVVGSIWPRPSCTGPVPKLYGLLPNA